MTTEPVSTERLIEECQGLVRSLARKVHVTLPQTVDLDDLIGYGQIGLSEAAKAYKPEKGAKFATFAYYRIRGAIYDGLTMMSWFRQSKCRELAYDRLANDFLEAEAEEPIEDSEQTLKEDSVWLRNLSASLAVAHLASRASSGQDMDERQIADPSTASPQAALLGREIEQKLRELVEALPGQEGTLIRLAYYEGLSLKDAARRLGVSKSWVSRLHARTLKRLAQSLRQLGMVD